MTNNSTRSERLRYPSDLSDRQWEAIRGLLRVERRSGRPRRIDLRDVVDGINYRWTTGCAWRMLPHDFPPWGTVYRYFRRWGRDDTLGRIRDVLLRRDSPRRARGRAGSGSSFKVQPAGGFVPAQNDDAVTI